MVFKYALDKYVPRDKPIYLLDEECHQLLKAHIYGGQALFIHSFIACVD